MITSKLIELTKKIQELERDNKELREICELLTGLEIDDECNRNFIREQLWNNREFITPLKDDRIHLDSLLDPDPYGYHNLTLEHRFYVMGLRYND